MAVAPAATRNRLKSYMDLYCAPGGLFLPDVNAIVSNLGNFTLVGACSHLRINQERDGNQQWYEFSSDGIEAMEPVETYPGKVKYTVTIKRTDLYDSNLLEAFGFNTVNLTHQLKPIVIKIHQPVPEDQNGNPIVVDGNVFKPRTYIITGVWFNSFPIEYEIDTSDLRFIQETECVASRLISI